jgi:hypothetical protein
VTWLGWWLRLLTRCLNPNRTIPSPIGTQVIDTPGLPDGYVPPSTSLNPTRTILHWHSTEGETR